jgi:hypothetical protein
MLLLVDLGLGVFFGGMAVTSANATEGSESVAASPTDTPTVEPTAKPVSRQSSRTPRVNADGSMTIQWLDTVRDENSLNYQFFDEIEVTVSQVQDLTYQAVNVEWSGAESTSPREFASNYIQVMQCWDDGSGSADPTHCQWGAPSSSYITTLGDSVGSRSLSYEGADPLQDYTGKFAVPPAPGEFDYSYSVPFVSAPSTAYPNGQSTQNSARFFDATSSNEISGARTGSDGTGETTFEIQTALEAPHLGCGAAQANGEARDCWLVVVPRGEYMVDSSYYVEGVSGRLMGSPLSQSTWNDRIEFPLTFRSVESGCPIGAKESRTTGNQMVVSAFSSWQSEMCAKKKVFGFSMIGDPESRRNITSETEGAARLAFIDHPLSTTEAIGSTIAYAPVVKSALVIGFNINYYIKGGSDIEAKDGQRLTNLTLSPRLIAKLLTQSYTDDVANGANQPYLAGNPRNLRQDPEFLRLNPEFVEFVNGAAPTGLMVPIGNEDVFAQLWKWIKSDDDANSFLAGNADDDGMVINPFYENLDINGDPTINSFPKADLSTFREYEYIPEPGFGTFELRPYVADLHDGAVRAYRGDSGSKTFWDVGRTPATFTSPGAQVLGRRFMLTVTDIVTAERLGLATAKLINPQGEAVQPTTVSINSAISEFVDSDVPGVKVSTTTLTKEESYPLSTLTYAAVDICRATISDLKSYKSLLTYVIGDGQEVGPGKGQIPNGYVPLDETQASSARDTISKISKEIKSPACQEHQGTGVIETPPMTTSSPPESPALDPVSEVGEAATSRFPGDPNSALRYSMLSALCFGIPMIAGGQSLIRKAKTL